MGNHWPYYVHVQPCCSVYDILHTGCQTTPPDDIHEYLLMTSGVMDPTNPFGVVLVTTPEMSRIPSHSVVHSTGSKAYTPYRQALDYAQSLIEMVTPSDNLGATHR